MKIAVLGGDGYCGWATALYLSKKGQQSPLSTVSPAGSGTMSWAFKRSRRFFRFRTDFAPGISTPARPSNCTSATSPTMSFSLPPSRISSPKRSFTSPSSARLRTR